MTGMPHLIFYQNGVNTPVPLGVLDLPLLQPGMATWRDAYGPGLVEAVLAVHPWLTRLGPGMTIIAVPALVGFTAPEPMG